MHHDFIREPLDLMLRLSMEAEVTAEMRVAGE